MCTLLFCEFFVRFSQDWFGVTETGSPSKSDKHKHYNKNLYIRGISEGKKTASINMHIEVQVALNFVISYLYNKLPRRRVNIFGEELEKALKDKFQGHWYPEKPFKVSTVILIFLFIFIFLRWICSQYFSFFYVNEIRIMRCLLVFFRYAFYICHFYFHMATGTAKSSFFFKPFSHNHIWSATKLFFAWIVVNLFISLLAKS